MPSLARTSSFFAVFVHLFFTIFLEHLISKAVILLVFAFLLLSLEKSLF